MKPNTMTTTANDAICKPTTAHSVKTTRRQFLAMIGAAGASLAMPQFLRAQAAPAPQRPNVIVVLLDDLGWGQFGPNTDSFTLEQLNPLVLERAKGKYDPKAALAAAKSAVPNITRLAPEGMGFSDGYVPSPLCAPSRTGLMTSCYPVRFGFYNNIDVTRGGVPREQPLMVQQLKAAGYATAAIGKWHLAAMKGENSPGMQPEAGQHPLDRGFDYFFGFNSHGTTYWNSQILWRNREHAQAEGYTTEQFTGEALGFIRRSKDKPFFLYLAYNAVHGPLGRPAPKKYLDRFHTGAQNVDNYYAYLNAADEGIGQIRKLLEEQGQGGNTLIILLSDNGAPGGTPVPANGQFLGFKGQPWQGGLRVPMIAWGPGRVKPGAVCRELVSSLDVMPTALAAAGTEPPAAAQVDGRSLLALLKGEGKPVHVSLCWAGALAYKWSGMGQIADELTAPPAWAVRKGKWILRYWTNTKSLELYDLDADPGERRNVAESHPEVVRELRTEYAAWYKEKARTPVAWSPEQWKLLAPGA